jgi:hypothetical protein
VLWELVYDEVLQRKNVRPLVRGSVEGEEEREAREGVRAAPPRRYRRKSMADCMYSGEEFLFDGDVDWRGEEDREEEGSRGWIGEGFKRRGHYWGSNSPAVSVYKERGREIRGEDEADKWVCPGSEREGDVGEAGLVRVVWAPGTAQVGLASSFSIFFDLFPFPFSFYF